MTPTFSTEHANIIDCQAAFSRGLCGRQQQWCLAPGEFDVHRPYFRESPTTGTERGKKRQKISVTDKATQERHEEIRSFVVKGLEEVQSLWPNTPCSYEALSTPPTKKEEEVIVDIDFVQLESLVLATHRFSCFNKETVVLEEECTEMETLSVFDTLITNPSDECRRLVLPKDHSYLVPSKASFLMGNLETSMDILSDHATSLQGFDCVVIDPPWPNKSVHRSSHYQTQDIYNLFKIPMACLLSSVDAQPSLVAVWVTNRPKYRRFVIDKLFKAWDVEWITDWYWLKLTTGAEPVMPLDSLHRKPYEQLLIGRPKSVKPAAHLPTSRVIASVPCKRHSRKPPLHDVLLPYLPKNPKCLEMFARCLTPEWTSWGNECIKFQHERYFIPMAIPTASDKDKDNNMDPLAVSTSELIACEEEKDNKPFNENSS